MRRHELLMSPGTTGVNSRIGVGGGVVGLLLIGAIFWFGFRRRSRNTLASGQTADLAPNRVSDAYKNIEGNYYLAAYAMNKGQILPLRSVDLWNGERGEHGVTAKTTVMNNFPADVSIY
jgi:hypothetical protein